CTYMKLCLGAALLASLAALTGCSSSPRAKAPTDVFSAMNSELSKTLPKSADEVDEELSRSFGTTLLTSATLVRIDTILNTPIPLPESRMSLAEADAPIPQTGGESVAPADIPDTRE